MPRTAAVKIRPSGSVPAAMCTNDFGGKIANRGRQRLKIAAVSMKMRNFGKTLVLGDAAMEDRHGLTSSHQLLHDLGTDKVRSPHD